MIQKTGKKIVTTSLQLLLNFSLIPVVIILGLLRYVFRIQFFRVNSSRIGHLAMNHDLFLRRKKLGLIKDNFKYIGIAATDISNKRLLQIVQRYLTIVQLPQPILLRSFSKFLATDTLLSRTGLFFQLPLNNNEVYEYTATGPVISFTKEEEREGQELLQRMGVNSWFVCFHSRDQRHIGKFLRDQDYRHTFRNGNILHYLPAADYLTARGGYALRLGATVENPLPAHKNARLIDYATRYRTEFGDIYLPAKCKFFLGDSTGLAGISYIFNVPVALANLIPLKYQPYSTKQDLFIPKKIWSVKEQRFLTFPEIINSPVFQYYHQRDYDRDQLIPAENTAEEILDLATEMNERLDGTWKNTPEDEKLQQQFKSLFPSGSFCDGFPARMGTKFLRENRYLLNEKAEK